MASLSIRSYLPADLDATIKIFRHAVLHGTGNDYSAFQRRTWASVADNREQWAAKRLGKPTCIAWIDDFPAGFTDLEADGHIDMLFVHARYHRRGIARALLEHVENEALKQSLPRLYTDASITARPCYEACGFKMVMEQTVTLRGVEFLNYRMEKPL